jgi:drug/metabolite transporter (DMT)-like permease
MVLAAVILGQDPTVVQVGGAVLVCAGVLAVTRARSVQNRRVPGPSPQPVKPQPVTANRT